jgi:hypothetical protein
MGRTTYTVTDEMLPNLGYTPDEANALGEEIGADLNAALSAFVAERVGPVIQLAVEVDGPRGGLTMAAAVAQQFRAFADELEASAHDTWGSPDA